MNNHNIEPELLQSPPRSVARRKNAGFGVNAGMGCIQLFILPHTIIGVGLILWALHSLAVIIFGVTVPAQIVSLDSHRGSKGGMTYTAGYTYPLGGQTYRSKANLNYDAYAALSIGSSLNVKVLSVTPDWDTIPLVPSGYSQALIKIPFALFWNGILSVFYLMMYGPAFLSRILVKNGTAVVGEIQDKKMRQGKGVVYTVDYAFIADPAASSPDTGLLTNAEPVRTQMTVRKDVYDRLNKGHWVTVLYDPKKPKRSILYLAASHDAVS